MMNFIKSYIKNNKGDMYIQTLICLIIFVMVFLFIFQASSSMTQKMWLDDKLNDITKIIAVTGDVSCDEVSAVENMVNLTKTTYAPNAERHEKYGELYKKYKKLVELFGAEKVID